MESQSPKKMNKQEVKVVKQEEQAPKQEQIALQQEQMELEQEQQALEQEEWKKSKEFLLEKGYNFAKFIQKNIFRDIILVYQYFNHNYDENIILRVQSSQQPIPQLKLYLEQFQKYEPYTYSTYISDHFSNEDETFYFIVYNSSQLQLNIVCNFYKLELMDILILNMQLLKIIENLINNCIYSYPLDFSSLGSGRKKEEIVLFDQLFIKILNYNQNEINPELQNSLVNFNHLKNNQKFPHLLNLFQILINLNYKQDINHRDTKKDKFKAINDYLNRVGIILLQIFNSKQMNEKELISWGRSEFNIKGCNLMEKYLKNIFWKYIINEKNEETHLSKLMSEINEIQFQFSQNQYSQNQEIKIQFFKSKTFIHFWNHYKYLNLIFDIDFTAQLNNTFGMDIESQKKTRLPSLYPNEQIIQVNKDLNNINGTIISFDFQFRFDKTNELIKNQQKIIFIEFLKKCSQIQRLDLICTYNNLKSEEFINIFKCIKNLSSLISLSLYFRECQIPNDTIKELMLSLQQFVNLRKLKLNFNNNQLETKQVEQIIEGLKNCNLLTDLKLDFSYNNIQFPSNYQNNIFSSLLYIPLTYLNIGISCKYDQKILLPLSEELKKCQLLKELTLKCYYLGFNDNDDSLILFGNQIKQYPSLLKLQLDFQYNKNSDAIKLEFCKNISCHTLINSIKIDFSSRVNFQIYPKIKLQVFANIFRKMKNFIKIKVKQ